MRNRLRRIRRLRGRRRSRTAPSSDLSRLLERLNPDTLAKATGNRVILHRHLTALGLPVPRLHGVIGRGGGWSAATGRPVLGAEAAGRFLAGLPGDLAVRPYAPALGSRTRLLRRDEEVLVDGEARRQAPAEVAAEAFADRACALFVVQEGLAVGELLRVTTFIAGDGRAEVVHVCRVGAEGAIEEIDADAANGAARALACRGAALLAPQRSIGWDIALTPDGPVILGADSRYAPVEGARFQDAVRAMERAASGSAA